MPKSGIAGKPLCPSKPMIATVVLSSLLDTLQSTPINNQIHCPATAHRVHTTPCTLEWRVQELHAIARCMQSVQTAYTILMSTALLKKQLNALTAEPEKAQAQTKAIKRALRKERQAKAAQASADAKRTPSKIKKRNLTYFKRTAKVQEATEELMLRAAAAAQKLK